MGCDLGGGTFVRSGTEWEAGWPVTGSDGSGRRLTGTLWTALTSVSEFEATGLGLEAIFSGTAGLGRES